MGNPRLPESPGQRLRSCAGAPAPPDIRLPSSPPAKKCPPRKLVPTVRRVLHLYKSVSFWMFKPSSSSSLLSHMEQVLKPLN